MKIVDQFPFEFYGSTFELFLTDKWSLILSVCALCEAMELDSRLQLRRIENTAAMSDGLSMVIAPVLRSDGSSQEREMACLALRLLPYWLGMINGSRVRPELKETIIHFKRELADVAWAAFRSQILPADMLVVCWINTARNLRRITLGLATILLQNISHKPLCLPHLGEFDNKY